MRAAVICALAVAVGLGASDATASPSDDLNRGRTSFKARDWESAAEVLNALLYPRVKLVRPEEAVEAYLMLGASAYQLGDRERALAEFTKALELDPERSITT